MWQPPPSLKKQLAETLFDETVLDLHLYILINDHCIVNIHEKYIGHFFIWLGLGFFLILEVPLMEKYIQLHYYYISLFLTFFFKYISYFN